ncbi:MAG TPA: HAD family hydrolase [Anaerolineales bacterium]|nr:HAD family hydrolase [Anaerolineales bacterium]
MFPAIFLDRDGVLIENRANYVRDWSQVKIFPEAVKALANSNLENYKIVIVTNQSAVGRGIISLETATNINNRLIELIHGQNGKLDGTYLCPHDPKDGCDCRKPKPGMLFQAAEKLSLDLKRSWMIGDAWSDVQAGQAAGARGTIIVKSGRGTDQLAMPPPKDLGNYLVCDDLSQALATIAAKDNWG